MMPILQAIAAGLLVAVGLSFMVVAAVGFARLPDVFCRLHVTGILDTLGAPLVLLGAAVWNGWNLTSGKLLLGLVFLFVTSPLVGHLLSWAALRSYDQGESEPDRDRQDSQPRDEVAT
jgi:multicomponent Na+:H+ antiporter subunit G